MERDQLIATPWEGAQTRVARHDSGDQTLSRNEVVMVYPYQGFSGTYVKHMPLALLYASTELVKDPDFNVKILDTRVVNGDWQPALREQITPDTLCVGISVMSGSPIKHAIAIGRFVKSIDPEIKVIWGGPHATFYPDTIIRDEWSVDYVVSGYASTSLHELCREIKAEAAPKTVSGVSWREFKDIRVNPDLSGKFEYIDYRDIPYDLIGDYSPYGQLDQDKRIFSFPNSFKVIKDTTDMKIHVLHHGRIDLHLTT